MMGDKHDRLSQEKVEALLGSVRKQRTWTEEEVLELAYQEHLTDEQMFDYCATPEAEPLRGVVEAHLAGCAFCQDLLDAVARRVADNPERVLVRVWRRVREGVEEMGRLVAGAGDALQAAGRWRPEIVLTGGGVLASSAEAGPGEGATFQLTLRLAEGEGLSLALVLRIRDAERFDLKATALAPETEPVVGLRLEVDGVPGTVTLVSDEWGDFAPAGSEPGFIGGLPLGSCQLRVVRPDGTEGRIDLPELRELCRRASRT